MTELLEVNSLEDIQAVISTGSKIIIEFGADWCQPCKAFLPHFQRFAKKYPSITCVRVDIDADPLVTSSFAVQSVPTVLYYNSGIRQREITARTVLQLEKEISV